MRPHINNDLAYLTSLWLLYQQLFGKSEKRLALLNRSSGEFFHLVQKSFEHVVLMGLRKLLDGATFRKDDNLSVRWLLEVAHLPNDPRRIATVEAICERDKDVFEKVKQLCDKELAHADAHVRNNKAALVRPTFGEVTRCLASLSEIMNLVNDDLCGAQFMHDMPLFEHTADSLVRTLVMGCNRRDEIMQAWKATNRHGPPPFPSLP